MVPAVDPEPVRSLTRPDFGGPLWTVYVCWLLSLLAMYPLCRWFAGVKARDDVSAALAADLSYIQGEMDDPALYARLATKLKEGAAEGVLFYLAIPPSMFDDVVQGLARVGAKDIPIVNIDSPVDEAAALRQGGVLAP